MLRPLLLAFLLALAACATEPEVPSPVGTENPLAETPVEVPADTLDASPSKADSVDTGRDTIEAGR